jgi:hypothetical protein
MQQRTLEWELGLKQEEQEVEALEQRFKDQREAVQRKKAELEWKKRNDWEWQQRQLQERLASLHSQEQADDALEDQAKRRMAELRRRDRDLLRDEVKVEKKIVEGKQLQRAEELARKKLELERLQRAQDNLQERQRRE